jgi:hypothetical protein
VAAGYHDIKWYAKGNRDGHSAHVVICYHLNRHDKTRRCEIMHFDEASFFSKLLEHLLDNWGDLLLNHKDQIARVQSRKREVAIAFTCGLG